MRKSAIDVKALGLTSIFGDTIETAPTVMTTTITELKRTFGSNTIDQTWRDYISADMTTVFGDSFRISTTDLEKSL